MAPFIVIGGLFLLLVVYLVIDWRLGRPLWRVKYPPDAKYNFEGGYSVRMTWWVAKDYAKIFGGEVVGADEYVPPGKRHLTAEEVESQDPQRFYYNGL